ncbi:ABC transporter substrate-binding protein [Dactylosporangium sp. NPDC051484]|uniref:ABC transporter substrate-binding protein n=1 Tax=Dactylosporangium sp. NPDC051484 TaxID=3154942 RepID=UPI00344BE0E2
MRRIQWRAGALVAAAASMMLAVSACGSSGGSSAGGGTGNSSGSGLTKSEIRLGQIIDATGPLGAAVANAKSGVQAWAGWVNANGGLNGHPVKIFYADTQGTPAGGLTAVQKLVEKDRVVALFGLATNVATSTIMPYAERKNIPILSGLPGLSDNLATGVYILGAPPALQGAIYAQAVHTLYPDTKKVAVMYCKESPGCASIGSAFQSSAKTLGLEVAYTAAVSLSAPDYTAQVIAARDAGAQAVLVMLSSPGIVSFSQASARQGWNPHIFIPNNLNTSTTDISQIPHSVTLTEQTAAAVPWNVTDPSPQAKEYIAAVSQYASGGSLGDAGWTNWVFGMMLKQASAEFGETVTSADIVNALVKLGTTDVGGLVAPVTWTASGGDFGGNKCGFFQVLEAGKWRVSGVPKVCAS